MANAKLSNEVDAEHFEKADQYRLQLMEKGLL